MKDIRIGTPLFLLFVLISAFSAQGAPHFFQFINSSSQSSSTITDSVSLLRNNIPPQHRTANTGIIPSPNTPRDSIAEIVGGQDQFFPGSDIHIRNRFDLAQYDETYDLVIVSQVIYIFLFNNSVDQQTMIDEGNRSDPTTSIYYIHEATTNGSHELNTPAYALDPILTPTVGFIDTTFQIPNSTALNGMTIGSDDEVTVFQYYPANNETSRLNAPIIRTDTFTLSSAATFSVETEFINSVSGDNTFRQGEFATARFLATSGATPIDNVSVSCSLHYADNDTEVIGSGFSYDLQDVLTSIPSSITDANGEIDLFVDTTYPDTPEDDYYFNITADFTGTEFYVADYEKVTTITANFTIENVPDIVTDTSFAITSIIPDPVEPPNANSTIVTVRIQAVDTYGGTGLYPLANIPINATLDIQELWVNINSSAATNGTLGWYLSDSNGEVEFDITTGFPNPYQTKTPTITVRADLQSNLEPTYPPGEPHRFVENNTGGKTVTKTDSFSIDPDFWMGNIGLLSRSAPSIRPGESAILEYEVFNAGNTGMKFPDVPVNITLVDSIPGVSLFINGALYDPYDIYGYYRTDSNGIIEVTVYTTYLVTPENIRNIALNITVDFENDSEIRWIGNVNAIDMGAADTLENFDKTWLSVVRSNDLTINPLFNNCTISFFTTNETGDATIRPGDDITVTFIVRNQQGSPLSGVYVNVSLVDPLSYPGVSLNNHPSSGAQDPSRSGYYNTSLSGYIVVYITTMYSTTPKDLDIGLIATADFENDSYSPWYVGSKGIRSDFRSNSSYSETTKTITVDAQYFIGRVVVKGSPRTIVPQNGTLIIEFELRLQEYETGAWVIPPAILIDDVNVSILINGQKPADLNMEITPAWQNSVASSVIFIIRTNTTSGIAFEGDYTINAEADYDSAKSFTYDFIHGTVPTGQLSGIWVNGSDPDGYSRTSQDLKVQNRDIITVTITDVTDPSHPDAGFDSDSGLYEIYRTSTFITITGTYEDATQDPVPNEDIQIFMNHSLANGNYLVPVTTELDGTFSVIVNLPLLTPLEDGIVIYGLDPTPPTPQEVRIGANNTRVVTTVDLSHGISGFNGDSVFVGESVSIQGQLTDNLGFPIDSSVNIFLDSFSELTGRLRLVGWNGTDEVGVPQVTSPNADGSFDLSYQILNNYYNDIFYIRLNITSSGLIHYRVNYNQTPINVYWDFSIDNLEIYIPSSGNTADLVNNSVYVIAGVENRDITLRGTLVDSNGTNLNLKGIRTTWNGTPSLSAVNNAGFFSFDYSFTGWESNVWIWEFQHILDNGTPLLQYFIITLQWQVVDETNPEIIITSPITFDDYILLWPSDTITIEATVSDPELNVVSDGLDNSSVIIIINGINRSMVQDPSNASLFSYDWNTMNVNDTSYRIMIIAEDLANNSHQSDIEIIFDVVSPSAIINVTENDEGYLVVEPNDGHVVISGSITDDGSITGNNTGINETSARLFIINPDKKNEIKINTSISISENSFFYEWFVILNPENLDLLSRNGTFSGTENWMINLTFSDLAGNSNQIAKDVKLDNDGPVLDFVDPLPEEIEGEELLINITFDDQESGIYYQTLTLELLYANGTKINTYTIRYDDNEMDTTDTEATITLDVSELENGDYFVRARVFDKTGNKNKGEVIESFTIYRPSPSNPLINMIQLILAPILAFGGGIGLAALYERLKGIRGG